MAKELPLHSPEQVRGYLDEAERIIDHLEVPGDLREIAYAKAIDLLAAKQIFYTEADAMAGSVLAGRNLGGMQ
jgi:hypothetical protein